MTVLQETLKFVRSLARKFRDQAFFSIFMDSGDSCTDQYVFEVDEVRRMRRQHNLSVLGEVSKESGESTLVSRMKREFWLIDNYQVPRRGIVERINYEKEADNSLSQSIAVMMLARRTDFHVVVPFIGLVDSPIWHWVDHFSKNLIELIFFRTFARRTGCCKLET